MKHHLNPELDQYLDLWKWFSEDADTTKDKIWMIASFFSALLSATLGCAAKYSFNNSKCFSLEITQPVFLRMVAVMGCMAIGY